MRASRSHRWLVALALGALGCTQPSPTGTAPSVDSQAATAAPSSGPLAPVRGELSDIPGGSFLAGSKPGSPGRDPGLEPRPQRVELGPFQIDRLPFPNDPALAPRRGVTREEAMRLCADRGGRLCTELEWERACRGPENHETPTGAALDPNCRDELRLTRCASGFGVVGMLGGLREWTASDVLGAGDRVRGVAVRGAASSVSLPDRRCSRRAVVPSTEASDLGFRCCRGAPNAAKVVEPALGETFRKHRLDAARLSTLLAAHPRTQELARDVKFFREPEAARTVLTRGRGDDQGFSFTVAPLWWNPAAGVDYLLVSARSGETTSFVVAFRVVGPDDFALAASFTMRAEPGPVAFAYSNDIRPRLHFSTCWGCAGETGKILFRDPDSVAILQP